MTKIYLNLMFVFIVALFGANDVRCQNTDKQTLNPPKWILGSWSNSAESDSRKFEIFAFVVNEITFSKGFGGGAEKIIFSDKFKGYSIKETIEPKLYRITFIKDADEHIYEFKMCDDCYVSTTKNEALTYSVTQNGKILRGHSTSAQAVLIRAKRQN